MKKLLRTALAAWAAVILLPACTVPSSYDPAVPHAVTPAVSADTPTDADPSAPKYVALTFDDGPRPSTTGRLLDGLALREIPATFFLVGSRLADDPEGQAIVRRMAAEGHQVGVHTFDHVMLTDLSRRDYDVQVGRTRALLAQIAGPGDYWLRPPYGITDQAAEQWAASPLILWSVDPEDWKDRDVHRIVSAVTEHVKNIRAKLKAAGGAPIETVWGIGFRLTEQKS